MLFNFKDEVKLFKSKIPGEYFVKDGSDNLTTQQEWPIGDQAGTEFGKITARLHLDFNANAKYISFYFPCSN